MPTKKLTRKQLYNLAWSAPLSYFADDFGLTDKQLRKICNKYDIPLPGKGYWKKIEYGKSTEKKKLGRFEKWGHVKIEMSESELSDEEHYLTKLARKKKEVIETCQSLIPVPDKLSKPHPLIKSAKANLSTKKSVKSWRNLPQCIFTDRNIISISVQKHNVPRALRIMDSLFKMIEMRGHQIENKDKTKLIVDEEEFPIRFREKHTRHSIKDGSWVTSELVPNDKLSIIFDDLYSKEWIDSSVPLEQKLPQIVAYFELRAVTEKEERREREIWREEYERKREIERKIQAEKEKEIQREEELISFAEKWNQTEILRDFIKEVENRKSNSPKVLEWIKWAKTKVRERDPLSEGVEDFVERFRG